MMRDYSQKVFPASLGFWLWCSVAAALLAVLPILLTPVIQAARGRKAAWGVVPPIVILVLGLLVELAWLLSISVPLKHPQEAPRP